MRDTWECECGLSDCVYCLTRRAESAERALHALMFEGKVYAAHHSLPPVAQVMYDIAEAALAPAEPPKDRGGEP